MYWMTLRLGLRVDSINSWAFAALYKSQFARRVPLTPTGASISVSPAAKVEADSHKRQSDKAHTLTVSHASMWYVRLLRPTAPLNAKKPPFQAIYICTACVALHCIHMSVLTILWVSTVPALYIHHHTVSVIDLVGSSTSYPLTPKPYPRTPVSGILPIAMCNCAIGILCVISH